MLWHKPAFSDPTARQFIFLWRIFSMMQPKLLFSAVLCFDSDLTDDYDERTSLLPTAWCSHHRWSGGFHITSVGDRWFLSR
jgi:hypothetical protein